MIGETIYPVEGEDCNGAEIDFEPVPIGILQSNCTNPVKITGYDSNFEPQCTAPAAAPAREVITNTDNGDLEGGTCPVGKVLQPGESCELPVLPDEIPC